MCASLNLPLQRQNCTTISELRIALKTSFWEFSAARSYNRAYESYLTHCTVESASQASSSSDTRRSTSPLPPVSSIPKSDTAQSTRARPRVHEQHGETSDSFNHLRDSLHPIDELRSPVDVAILQLTHLRRPPASLSSIGTRPASAANRGSRTKETRSHDDHIASRHIGSEFHEAGCCRRHHSEICVFAACPVSIVHSQPQAEFNQGLVLVQD